MSKFATYAAELYDLCHGYLMERAEAEAEYVSATEFHSRNKRPAGVWNNPTVEQVERANQAEIGLVRAMDRKKRAEGSLLDETKNRIKVLRERLENALAAYFLPNPAAVDSGLMAIIDSGMLSVSEYTKLFEQMVREDNVTMARLVSAAAREAAENETDPVKRGRLTVVAEAGKGLNADMYLKKFDTLVDMFSVCSRNGNMVSAWMAYAGKHIADF